MPTIEVEPISFSLKPGESVAYYPTLLLLDKMSPPPLLSHPAPLAGLAVTAVASLVWNRCLASYRGTGS